MASGNFLCQWGAQDFVPPASNYPTLDSRNGHLVLDFDAGTDESADAEAILPAHYAGGGLTLRICWMASSATSGDVVWNAQIERQEDEGTDLDADSFAAAQAVTATAPATSGAVQYSTITFTSGAQMDSLAAGERFRLRVTRDADNGSDTLVGDVELLSVALIET